MFEIDRELNNHLNTNQPMRFVVDVLGSPYRTLRSSHAFNLNPKALRPRIDAFSKAVRWTLYCLGIWNNYPSEYDPSAKDCVTARTVSLTPTNLFMVTPTRFYALTAGTQKAKRHRWKT